jgi:probable glucitol transport protein GutA
MALSYLTFFVTEWTGVSPTLMATIYTAARFGDLGIQVIAGNIMQRVKKFRPFLLAVPIISQFGNFISFWNPNIPIPAKLVLLTVGYCMIHFPMNFSTIATNTLMMRVAGPNPANRTAITVASLQGSSAMRIIQPLVTLPLILWLIERGLPGYLYVQLLYAAVTMTASIVLYIVTKPYESPEALAQYAASSASNVKPPSFVQMYKLALKNIPIVVLLISSSINSGIGGQVFSAGVMYYWRYSVGSYDLQPLAGSIAGVVALITSVTGPIIARKIGKRNSWLFNCSWQVLCYLGIVLFADGQPWVFIAMTCLQNVSTSVTTSWGIQLWLDAAEVQLYETGIDIRSFTMGLNNYPIKLGFIISGPFVAFMLNNSGYSAADGVGMIADTARFIRIWMLIPIVGLIISFINIFLGYKVDENYARECAAANAKAAAERAAATAAGRT